MAASDDHASHLMTPTGSPLTQLITAKVANFYEAFPYPRYPLLAKPVWRDGYLAAAAFAEVLAGRHQPRGQAGNVLLAGAGEIVSYVIRQWEPTSQTLHCVDLSQRSLQRSRFRLWPSVKPTQFVQSDLDDFLERNPQLRFNHVDAFGMLHHMANPGQTLRRLNEHLVPGGTIRLMVYNTPARRWLNELQRAFVLLGVDPYIEADRQMARALLKSCGAVSKALEVRLEQLGKATLEHDVRFADTFLHPHELRLAPQCWLELITNSGLEVIGLFDRYAELDDLQNPLWQPPTAAALTARANDGRYENNLELFLRQAGGNAKALPQSQKWRESWNAARVSVLRPPVLWFSFSETKSASQPLRRALWRAYLNTIVGRRIETVDRWFNPDKPDNRRLFQRLARLGAVLPVQLASPSHYELLLSPLADNMVAPSLPVAKSFVGSVIESQVREWLCKQKRFSEKRLTAILQRLDRAQAGYVAG